MADSRRELIVVMPVYNEEGCIAEVIASWHRELQVLGIDYQSAELNELFHAKKHIAVTVRDDAGNLLVTNTLPTLNPYGHTSFMLADLADYPSTAGKIGTVEFKEIGHMIIEVVDALGKKGDEGDPEVEAKVRARVRELCSHFPIYP